MKTKLKTATKVFKALAHETRLMIILGLSQGEGCNVSKIIVNLELPQSTISQHLSILKNAGIVEGYKKGNEVCYKVIDEKIIQVLKDMDLFK
jgi:ArsR family transcriptional regulator